MIYDQLAYLLQLPLPEPLCRKISVFADQALALAEGRHEIEGALVYASKFTYATAVDGVFEAHRRYADLQIILKGEERLGVTLEVPAREISPYDESGDAVLYPPDQETYSTLIMRSGYFALLLPRDIHMPGLALNNQPSPVTKVVIKIAVELFR